MKDQLSETGPQALSEDERQHGRTWATLCQIQECLRHKRTTTTEKYLQTLERSQAAANG